MSSENSLQIGEKKLVVRRGRVGSVDLYEIKENELELLEKGSPASLQLNFSIFLLSIAFSAIVALATAIFSHQITETVFVMVAVVGIMLGAYLLVCWWKDRANIDEMIKKIRERIPPDVVSSSPPDNSENLSGSDDEPSG